MKPEFSRRSLLILAPCVTPGCRELIKQADPDVKVTFAKGASLKDPGRLFNSSLDGNVRRALDIHEGEVVDESAFKALVREAVAFNGARKSKPPKKAK